MPDNVDNTKEWQKSDNWECDSHAGMPNYIGPPPPPRCMADRLIEFKDGSRYDPATGLTWPSRGGYPMPDDVDTSGEQWVYNGFDCIPEPKHYPAIEESTYFRIPDWQIEEWRRERLARKWYRRLWWRMKGWWKRWMRSGYRMISSYSTVRKSRRQ